MKIKGIYIAVAVFLYLIFRKDDGLLPDPVVTTVNKIKNAIGMQKGGINNPGNIRTTSIKWIGKITKPGDQFESFDTLQNGVIAMYKNLLSYRKRGITTINHIINTWAPAEDNNDPDSYVKTVCKLTGIEYSKQLSLDDYPALISAMSKVEGNHYVTADYVKAVV